MPTDLPERKPQRPKGDAESIANVAGQITAVTLVAALPLGLAVFCATAGYRLAVWLIP